MTPAGGLSRVQTMRVCLQFTSPLALCSPPVRSCGAAGGAGGTSQQNSQSRQVSTTCKVFILEQHFALIENTCSILTARMCPTHSITSSTFPEGQRGGSTFGTWAQGQTPG